MGVRGTSRSVIMVFVLVLMLWPLLLSCGGGGEQQQSSSETTQPDSSEERLSAANVQELDNAIAEVINEKNLPGVLVAVSVPGQGEYITAQGTANLDTRTEPDLADPFRIGSITKPFIATAILQLVDQGKLSKSDTLSNWYPDFPNADEITIDNLLRMRSGIADYWDEETLKQYYDNPLEDISSEDIIEAAASKADQFEPPDQETKYTDTNYNLLEEILKKVSGNDTNTQLTENIFEPLGMTNTLYPTNEALPGNLHGYGLNSESGEFEDKTIINPAPADGAGAMISNISDLGIFARALYEGTLLNPETQEARLETQQLEGSPESVRFGEGIGQLGKYWGFSGTIQGFSSEMYYLPEEDATIVIAVNRCDADFAPQSGDVLGAVGTLLFPEYAESG